ASAGGRHSSKRRRDGGRRQPDRRPRSAARPLSHAGAEPDGARGFLMFVANRARTMSAVPMAVTAGHAELEQRKAARARLARLARPAIGLIVPVGAALAWEIAVRLGFSNGRLLPPPSR